MEQHCNLVVSLYEGMFQCLLLYSISTILWTLLYQGVTTKQCYILLDCIYLSIISYFTYTVKHSVLKRLTYSIQTSTMFYWNSQTTVWRYSNARLKSPAIKMVRQQYNTKSKIANQYCRNIRVMAGIIQIYSSLCYCRRQKLKYCWVP